MEARGRRLVNILAPEDTEKWGEEGSSTRRDPDEMRSERTVLACCWNSPRLMEVHEEPAGPLVDSPA